MSKNNNVLIYVIISSALIMAIGFVVAANQIKPTMSDEELGKKIDQGIEKYIQKQMQAQEAQRNQAEQDQLGNVKPVSKTNDHIFGNKDADISLIEYSDFECPFCKTFHPIAKQIIDNYGGKVNWVYRHYPLGFHQNARKEAEASECANELGGNDKFWEYTNKIYERTTSNGTGFALDQLVPLAKELGLNEEKFKACLDSGKYADHIQQDMSEGSAAGVSGTPGNIVINNKTGKAVLKSGALPFETFKAIIDQL